MRPFSICRGGRSRAIAALPGYAFVARSQHECRFGGAVRDGEFAFHGCGTETPRRAELDCSGMEVRGSLVNRSRWGDSE